MREDALQQISTQLTGNCLYSRKTYSRFSQLEEPLLNISKWLSTWQACLGAGYGTCTNTVSTNSVGLGKGHWQFVWAQLNNTSWRIRGLPRTHLMQFQTGGIKKCRCQKAGLKCIALVFMMRIDCSQNWTFYKIKSKCQLSQIVLVST